MRLGPLEAMAIVWAGGVLPPWAWRNVRLAGLAVRVPALTVSDTGMVMGLFWAAEVMVMAPL